MLAKVNALRTVLGKPLLTFDYFFSKNVQQYEYELCLFRSAVQV
jgi:hypothetical protein